METKAKLLLVGATGLVGRHVLELALDDARVASVVAPVRRALPAHPKLSSPQVDFDRLDPESSWWNADAVICTLGTTMKSQARRPPSGASTMTIRLPWHGWPTRTAHPPMC